MNHSKKRNHENKTINIPDPGIIYYLRPYKLTDMIENIHIIYTNTLTKISWLYNGRKCYFENPGHAEYEHVIEWIKSMPREDQEEHFVTPRLDYVECLGLIMNNGVKYSTIS